MVGTKNFHHVRGNREPGQRLHWQVAQKGIQ
jgi:hypothetical protein